MYIKFPAAIQSVNLLFSKSVLSVWFEDKTAWLFEVIIKHIEKEGLLY